MTTGKRHPGYKRLVAGGIWAVALALLLLGLVRPNAAAGSGAGRPLGSPAPNFTLQSLAGAPVTLSAYRGRPVLVHFWASWCPSCRDEMPDLEAAYQAYRGQGLEILAVNVGEAGVAMAAFVDRMQVTFPVLVDEHSRVTQLFDVIPLPSSYFVDAQGIIRAKQAGPVRADQLRRHLARILPGGDSRG